MRAAPARGSEGRRAESPVDLFSDRPRASVRTGPRTLPIRRGSDRPARSATFQESFMSSSFVIVTCSIVSLTTAIRPGPQGANRSPQDVLKDAVTAAKEVRTAIYNASVVDQAGFMGTIPQVEAAVKMQRADAEHPSALGGHVAMRGRILRSCFTYDTDNPDSTVWLYHDGKQLSIRFEAKPWQVTVDHTRHPLTALARPELALWMSDLFAERPYEQLLNAARLAYGGRHEVEGWECERVDARLSAADTRQPEAPLRPLLSRCPSQRWYFSVDDHLPRRVEYFPDEQGTGA
ncbi:MAG: hypothetical protein C4547_15475, partial [Phycisphaerales bacterium]